LEDNEGYFDTLQATHDGLADRLAELETEHAEIVIERAGDAQLLQDAYDEIVEMRDLISKRDDEKVRVERVIVELQQQLYEADHEIESLTVLAEGCEAKHTEKAEKDQIERCKLELDLRDKQERICELEDLLRAGLETESEVRQLSVMIKTRDERILDLESRQTERQRQLELGDNMLSKKEAETASLSFRMHELVEDKVKLEKDCQAAVRSISAKDTIIGVLRDKLGTAAFEKDEVIAENQLLKASLETKQSAGEEEVRGLKRELELQKRDGAKIEAERKEAVAELERVMQEIKLNNETSDDDKQEAMRKVEEAVAHLEDEKASWEEEREQVGQAV